MRFKVLLLALALIPASAVAEAQDLSRAAFEQGQAKMESWHVQRLAASGLAPLKRALPAGGERRQIAYENAYGFVGPVGIEFMHFADGRTEMTVAARGGVVATIEAPSAAWADLMVQEQAAEDVFPKYEAWVADMKRYAKTPPPPPPICHGGGAVAGMFDTKGTRFALAGCSSPETPWRYATAYARIALSVRPQCPSGANDPFAAVEACYAPHKPN